MHRHTPIAIRTLTALAALAAANAAEAQCGPFFATPQFVWAGRSVPGDLRIADLNGDGRLDMAYASRGIDGNCGVSVLIAAADGSYTQSQYIQYAIAESNLKILIEDVNRDGIRDLVLTEYSTGSLRVHLGLGGGHFATDAAFFSLGAGPSSIAMGDLNNDGKPDLIATNLLDSTYSVVMGNGDGTFQNRVSSPTGAPFPSNVMLTDLNGDHRLDAVFTTTSPSTVVVLIGNGNGTFRTPVVYPSLASQSYSSAAMVDLTGDGVPDFLGTFNNVNFVFHRGHPDGTLEAGAAIYSGGPGYTIRTFDIADVNADGLPDIFAVAVAPLDVNSSLLLVYLNNGAGNFAAPLSFGITEGQALGGVARAADRNGDGLADLVYVNRLGQFAALDSASGGAVRILSAPVNVTAAPGSSASLTVAAEGAGVGYEWLKSGQPVLESARVTGVHTPTLSITELEQADAAVYTCRISNPCSTASASAFIAIAAPANPCPADFNLDRFVDFFDFTDFIDAFEEGC